MLLSPLPTNLDKEFIVKNITSARIRTWNSLIPCHHWLATKIQHWPSWQLYIHLNAIINNFVSIKNFWNLVTYMPLYNVCTYNGMYVQCMYNRHCICSPFSLASFEKPILPSSALLPPFQTSPLRSSTLPPASSSFPFCPFSWKKISHSTCFDHLFQ